MRAKRTNLTPQDKAALLGISQPAPGPVVDPAQALVDKYDLNNPMKRLLVAGGLIGGFMGILRIKSIFN